MIPIECPRCGKTGHVPPDRLGARLLCNRCHSTFHMDNGGRMVLGEPGGSGIKKSAKSHPTLPAVEFNLAQTWQEVPKPAKFGVPTAFVLLTGWMLFPSMSSTLAYQDQAEVVARALLNGNRSKVVGLATPSTAEAAGKWYDLMHAPIAEKGAGSAVGEPVRASLMSGNPERDSSLGLGVVIMTDTVSTNFNLKMVNDGGRWKFDAATALDEAEKLASAIKVANAKGK